MGSPFVFRFVFSYPLVLIHLRLLRQDLAHETVQIASQDRACRGETVREPFVCRLWPLLVSLLALVYLRQPDVAHTTSRIASRRRAASR